MCDFIDGLFLYTATCANWKRLILKEEYQKVILQSLDFFTENKVCNVYGFVIMPNHIHLIIGINPEVAYKFQLRFQKYTAQQIIREMKRGRDPILKKIVSAKKDRKFQFWESHPHWRAIYTSASFYETLRYVHTNPLQTQWRLCEYPTDYEMSSARSYEEGKSYFRFLSLYD